MPEGTISNEVVQVKRERTSVDEFKTHMLITFFFLLLIVVSTAVGTYCGYKIGLSKGEAKGMIAAYKLNPPIVQTGANPQMITNNNVRKPMNRFSLSLFPLHAGWCE